MAKNNSFNGSPCNCFGTRRKIVRVNDPSCFSSSCVINAQVFWGTLDVSWAWFWISISRSISNNFSSEVWLLILLLTARNIYISLLKQNIYSLTSNDRWIVKLKPNDTLLSWRNATNRWCTWIFNSVWRPMDILSLIIWQSISSGVTLYLKDLFKTNGLECYHFYDFKLPCTAFLLRRAVHASEHGLSWNTL